MELLDLPSEILVKIMGLCTPNDIFRLGRTCRRLRAFSEDFQIQQQSFLKHAPETACSSVPSKSDLIKRIQSRTVSLDGAQANLVWCRLAVATTLRFHNKKSFLQHICWWSVERVMKRISKASPVPDEVGNTVGLMSTLAVIGYPWLRMKTCDVHVPHAEGHLNLPNYRDDSRFNYGSFSRRGLDERTADYLGSLATLVDTVRRPGRWMAGPILAREFEETLVLAQSSFCLAVGQLYVYHHLTTSSGDWIHMLYWSDYIFLESARKDSRGIWGIFTGPGRYPFMFAQGIAMGIISHLPRFRWIHTPCPHKFPFLAGLERGNQIPLLDQLLSGDCPDPGVEQKTRWMGRFGSSTSWAGWLEKAVDIQIEDICLGEWTGLTTGLWPSNPFRFRGIQWSAVPDSEDLSRINLEADNLSVDSYQYQGFTRLEVLRTYGPYSLRGVLFPREAYRFELTLQHHQASPDPLLSETKLGFPGLTFCGFLTPLGMAGFVLGSDGQPNGSFWFYKTAWTYQPTTST